MKRKIGKNWVNRLKGYIDKNPITVLIIIVVFFISSFFTIFQGISWAINTINSTFLWRNIEYKKINSVRPGMYIQKITDVFGTPFYTRNMQNNKSLTENTYKGRGYWIDTISNDSGEVLLYTITSCDKNFSPTIDPNPLQKSITLQKSTLSSIGDNPSGIKYFASGATANSYFFDEYSWGNPSNYETVYVGYNDQCPQFPKKAISQMDDLFKLGDEANLEDPYIQKFRDNLLINTYAETAPMENPVGDMKYFQVGVDRIQVRNLYSLSAAEIIKNQYGLLKTDGVKMLKDNKNLSPDEQVDWSIYKYLSDQLLEKYPKVLFIQKSMEFFTKIISR